MVLFLVGFLALRVGSLSLSWCLYGVSILALAALEADVFPWSRGLHPPAPSAASGGWEIFGTGLSVLLSWQVGVGVFLLSLSEQGSPCHFPQLGVCGSCSILWSILLFQPIGVAVSFSGVGVSVSPFRKKGICDLSLLFYEPILSGLVCFGAGVGCDCMDNH